MITLWRMITFGFQNFWRNVWLSLVTILIVVLNLFLMSVITGLNVVGHQALTAVKTKIDLSVYFTSTTSEQRVAEVQQELKQLPEVQSIRLVSRDEHLEALRKSQPNNSLVNEAIKQLGDNPLGAGLVITAKTLDGYGAIAKAIQSDKYSTIVENTGNEFATNQTVIAKLSLIVNRVQLATLWLTGLFALIAFLMIYNTIRITIYSHREEIGIMKLVGASDAFVRGPFVVTSILYGLVASLLTTLLLIPILTVTNPFFAQFFAGYDVNVLAYFQSHALIILGFEVLAGVVISMFSSVLAIGRYLRV